MASGPSSSSSALPCALGHPPHTVWRHPGGLCPLSSAPLDLAWRRLCLGWIRLRRLGLR